MINKDVFRVVPALLKVKALPAVSRQPPAVTALRTLVVYGFLLFVYNLITSVDVR